MSCQNDFLENVHKFIFLSNWRTVRRRKPFVYSSSEQALVVYLQKTKAILYFKKTWYAKIGVRFIYILKIRNTHSVPSGEIVYCVVDLFI